MRPESGQQKFSGVNRPRNDASAHTRPGFSREQIGLRGLIVRSLYQLKVALRGSKYFILYLFTAALFLSVWHSRATHRFSLGALVVFVALCVLSLIYGRFFIKLTSLSFKASSSLSLQFVCGYLVINTILFLLSLFTPFAIAMNVSIVGWGGLLILLSSRGIAKDAPNPADYLPDFLCLLLSGIAATLWCTDVLRPVAAEGSLTIYQTNHDSFFHSRLISSFAQARGFKTMSIILMSDQPVPLYHYAMYLTPAAISFFITSSAYITFVSFLIPFGILLTGLAAFSLVGSVWGRWPGIAATLAVAMLPDAYQQGLGNKFFSYYPLQEAAPGGLYGVACLAIAWMFILDGCKASRVTSILFGYVILIVSVVYKAQLFVANAFLLMIYPCVFFRGLQIRWRVVSGVVLVSLFCLVVSLSQHVNRIPTLRLDWSALRPYARAIVATFDPGFLKSFYQVLLLEGRPGMVFLPWAASMLVLCTFGLWTAAYAITSFLQKARIGAAASLFPFFVIVNYVVMSLGLAIDANGVGMPVELLHRPFVWAYFVVAAWGGAGAYVLLFGDRPPASKSARILATAIAILSFSVPLAWAHNLQILPREGYDSYRAMNPVPSGLVKACSYIRKNSQSQDLVQDSENDPRFWVTGLAERQDFAVECKPWERLCLPALRRRLDELAAFKSMTTEFDVVEFARRNKISWYILRPEAKVAWPTSVLKKPVFRAGGYRVYHFTP